MVWLAAAYLATVVLVSYALQPKVQNATPSGIEDLTVPSASRGIEIPVLFGTRKISGANVVWYGDLRTTAIKSSGGKK